MNHQILSTIERKGREISLKRFPATPGTSKDIGRDRPHRAAESGIENAWDIEMTEETTCEW